MRKKGDGDAWGEGCWWRNERTRRRQTARYQISPAPLQKSPGTHFTNTK